MTTTFSKRGYLPTWLLATLIITALSAQAARILSGRASTGETPVHSANDRSRWCSVVALGGFGQFEIDPFLEIRDPKTKRRTWYTIDLVRHRGLRLSRETGRLRVVIEAAPADHVPVRVAAGERVT